MILLAARDVSRQFDADPLFASIGFEVRPAERIGLVGPNGSGKTTLLRILAGLDEADQGTIERHPSAEVALLDQQPAFAPGRTLIEEARDGLAHLYGLQHQASELARAIATADVGELDRLQKRYDTIQSELRRLDAYHVDHRVDEVLHGLGFSPEDNERPLTTFSGGQQNRAALARLLLRAPDVLLLDEPTNHLDIAATEWLESWLARTGQAVIVVSHDRYFLDRVTNRILELIGGRVTDYQGNFSHYRRQRAERIKVFSRTLEKQQEFIARTEDFIRRNKSGQKHAQAADREKKLERVERVEVPREVPSLPMGFGKAARAGDWVLDADDVAKGFDGPLFAGLTLRVERGDRLGIFGPNGSGKTTLLKTLIGELRPDAGTVRLGAGVTIGYLDQHLAVVDPQTAAVEAVRPPGATHWTEPELRKLLARFGIRGDMAFQSVGSMSGGERSKIALARLAAREANVLILDEPTNHLDLWARDALEESLHEFDGTVLFVSHDRYFLDRVAGKVLVIEDGRVRQYDGNYSDYLAFRESEAREAAPRRTGAAETAGRPGFRERGATPDAAAASARPKRRFPYRKLDDIEDDIAVAESRLQELESALANPDLHRQGERVRQALADFDATRTRLQQLYEHWEEMVEMN